MGALLRIGSRGDAVKELQTQLAKLGMYNGDADGIFGPNTEDAVELLQDKYDLYEDGIVGSDTRAALAKALGIPAPAVLAAPDPTTSTKMALKSILANNLGVSTLSRAILREDAYNAMLRVQRYLVSLGSGIATAGGIRPLAAGGGKAQSATSLHYLGLAIDLSMGSGMNKESDPYIVVRDGARHWRVYARVKTGGKQMTLNAVLCSTSNKKTTLREAPVSGLFVDLTAIMKENGFERIGARKSFLRGGSYSGAEWWHFQYEAGMVPGVSTFGGELLKIRSLSEIKANFCGNWNALKGAVWQQDFF